MSFVRGAASSCFVPAGLALVCLVALGRSAGAQDSGPAGLESVPLDRIPAELRRDVRRVAGAPTVRCEVAARPVQTTGPVYRTLLSRLPLAARLLRALDLGDYAIADRPDGTFSIDDKSGARALCTRALDEPALLVVLAPGSLNVPVLPSIRGTGLIVIRFPARAEGGLTCSAEVAFRLDSGILHRLSRPLEATLSEVLRAKTAELVDAATGLSEAIAKDPWAIYRRLQAVGLGAEDLRAYRDAFLSA